MGVRPSGDAPATDSPDMSAGPELLRGKYPHHPAIVEGRPDRMPCATRTSWNTQGCRRLRSALCPAANRSIGSGAWKPVLDGQEKRRGYAWRFSRNRPHAHYAVESRKSTRYDGEQTSARRALPAWAAWGDGTIRARVGGFCWIVNAESLRGRKFSGKSHGKTALIDSHSRFLIGITLSKMIRNKADKCRGQPRLLSGFRRCAKPASGSSPICRGDFSKCADCWLRRRDQPDLRWRKR